MEGGCSFKILLLKQADDLPTWWTADAYFGGVIKRHTFRLIKPLRRCNLKFEFILQVTCRELIQLKYNPCKTWNVDSNPVVLSKTLKYQRSLKKYMWAPFWLSYWL